MKNRKWLYIVLVVVCGIGIWLCCLNFAKNDYLNVLPGQSKALAVINVERLIKEADLDETTLKQTGLLSERYADIGIDWSKDIYSFVTTKEYVGALAAVDDKDKLKAFFEKSHEKGYCGNIEKHQGYQWVVLHDSWLIGFDDEAFLLMGPAVGSDLNMLRQDMLRFFYQDEDESGRKSLLYEGVKERRTSVSLASTLDVLPTTYSVKFKSGLPEHATLSDIRVVADFEFTPTMVTMNCEVGSDNKEIDRHYEGLAVINDDIEGTFISEVDSTTLLWASTHIEGKGLLDLLRKNPDVRTFLLGLNFGLDADQIIRSMKGDVAFRLDSITQSDKPVYTMLAELSDQSFLDGSDYWTQSVPVYGGISLKKLDKTDFRMDLQGKTFFFGVNNDCFYMTSSEASVGSMFKKSSSVLKPWEKDICSSRYFVWLNMRAFKTAMEKWSGLHAGYADWTDKLDVFDSFVVHSKDARHIAFVLKTKDNKNLFKELLK